MKNILRKAFVLTLLMALCLPVLSFIQPHNNALAQGPGNGRIVFSSRRDGDYEIYVMNGDGSNPTNLTNYPTAMDETPELSPDGSKIAFMSNRDGNYEIYVMDADGSNPTNLTNHPAESGHPTWSPDGTQILFEDSRDSGSDIYVMNADGSNPVNLSNNLAYDIHPAWSPDGTQIVFASNRVGNKYDIYIMNADGSNQINLTNHPANDYYPDWSPDGTQILFPSYRDSDIWQIYVMNVDGSNPTNLSNSGTQDNHSDWSPDGTQIVFYSRRDGNNEIYVMNADGTNQTRLTNNSATDFYPDWSAESSCRIDAPAEVFEGDTIPITIRCDNLVEEAFGFQVGHSVVGEVTPQSTSYTPGSFVTDAGSDILEVQNTLDLYVVSRRVPAPAVSGGLMLASVDYTANLGQLTDGVATFTLDPFILGDIYGNPIDALAPMPDAIVTIRDRYTVLGTVESEIAVNEINNVTVDLGPEYFFAANASGNSVAFDFTDKFDTDVLDLFADMDAHLECSDNIVVTQSVTDLGPITLLAGDVTDDGDPLTPATIDLLDSTAIGLAFGSSSLPDDINVDGVVDVLDLISVGRNYGATAPIACIP